MDFDYSSRVVRLQAKLADFMSEHVYPAEADYFGFLEEEKRAGRYRPSWKN